MAVKTWAKLHQTPCRGRSASKAFSQRVERSSAAPVQNRQGQGQTPFNKQQICLERGKRRGHLFVQNLVLLMGTLGRAISVPFPHTWIICCLPGQPGHPASAYTPWGSCSTSQELLHIYFLVPMRTFQEDKTPTILLVFL